MRFRGSLALFLACLAGLAPCCADAPKEMTRDASAALLRVDAAARQRFEKEHPGVLPEGPLRARLPLASVRAFNWCSLNQDFYVHNQGRSSSCWANSAAEALECNWLIRNGIRHEFSPQPILDYTQKSCCGNGGMAFDVLLKHGTALTSEYRFTGQPGKVPKGIATRFRAAAWGRVGDGKAPPKVEQVKTALLEHGPLVVNLFSTTAFKKYGRGVFAEHYHPGKNEPAHNHEVLLLGWDDSKGRGAWFIKNSWGEKWGEGGYGWIEYGCNNVCYDAWWVTAQNTYYTLPQEDFLKLVPDADPPMGWNSPIAAIATVKGVRLERDAMRNGKKGLAFHLSMEIGRAKGKRASVRLRLLDQSDRPMPAADRIYSTSDGHMQVAVEVAPSDDTASFQDLALFLPYSQFPAGGRGRKEFHYEINIFCDGKWISNKALYKGRFSFPP